jgi:hypothetical protein
MHRSDVRIVAGVLVALAWVATPSTRSLAPPMALAETPAPARISAKDGWKKEFEEVCARTQDAMTLPTSELRSLVERCDNIKPALETAPASEGKVYVKRLLACRNLYAYVLESRQVQ